MTANTIFDKYGAFGNAINCTAANTTTCNGTTGDTIFRLNASNWQDPDYINFKVFMIVDQKYTTLSD